MIQVVGILLIVSSLAITGWWIAKGKPYGMPLIILCGIAVFVGCFLTVHERVTEFSLKDIGTIKTAAKQATADAKQIADIRNSIEAQSATVDLVAKQASAAMELSKQIADVSAQAEKRLRMIESTFRQANEKVSKLEILTDFNTVATEARNDSRIAFDQLETWKNDKSYPLNALAGRAWKAVLDEHAQPFHLTGFTVPWKKGFDPSTLDIKSLRQYYASAPRHIKPALIEYIWKRNDIPKRDRMEFLIEVMQQDESLKAVEYASRYFNNESQLKIKPLAVDRSVDWWEKNKDKIQ